MECAEFASWHSFFLVARIMDKDRIMKQYEHIFLKN